MAPESPKLGWGSPPQANLTLLWRTKLNEANFGVKFARMHEHSSQKMLIDNFALGHILLK